MNKIFLALACLIFIGGLSQVSASENCRLSINCNNAALHDGGVFAAGFDPYGLADLLVEYCISGDYPDMVSPIKGGARVIVPQDDDYNFLVNYYNPRVYRYTCLLHTIHFAKLPTEIFRF